MSAVEIPNARFDSAIREKGVIHITATASDVFGPALEKILAICIERKTRCIDLRIGLPHKPRSTGPQSQNAHCWGHARQIAQEIGEGVEETMYWILARAEKRGYPVARDKFGNPKPKRWSEASSAEAVYAIDQAHEDAAFLGMTLKEEE